MLLDLLQKHNKISNTRELLQPFKDLFKLGDEAHKVLARDLKCATQRHESHISPAEVLCSCRAHDPEAIKRLLNARQPPTLSETDHSSF